MKPKVWRLFGMFVMVALLLSTTGAFAATPQPPEAAEGQISLEAMPIAPITANVVNPGAVQYGMALLYEMEPNDTPATANALPGADLVVQGNIFPNADVDYFSFTGNAGDRVYAATMTSFSANGSTDSVLTLFSTDGITVIEEDINDGSFGAFSSSIAGATLPAPGTYYLRVQHSSPTNQLRPYFLYLKVQSGAPTPETEPNLLGSGGQPLPVSGWVSGVIDPAADHDAFALSLNAGDTVFLSLDLDPERDGSTSWNGRIGLGIFGANILVVNDANTTSPNSEAFFFTVKDAGTYYVYVDEPAALGDPIYTYHLSVSVIPQTPEGAFCTTYTSTDVPVTIPTGPAMVQSTLTVPGNPRIADLDVTVVLTHTNMLDLDVVLVAPGGNEVILFNDRGSNTQTQMNLTLDDEAAIPISIYTTLSGMIYQPQLNYRLSWFDGQNAGGVWTLKLSDDLADNGGVLQSWSLTVCESPPPLACPVGYTPVTVFSSDFEANNGGFTTAGTGVDWAWGTPTVAPINTCNSGSNCWKTNLNGNYAFSTTQDLLSPAIDLSGFSGPVIMRWAQKYQMESASFDHAYIQMQEAGGANPTRLWTWLDATMTSAAGNPAVTVQQSAGWSERWADISSYAGQSIEALFHLDSDTSVNLAGLAIDDFSITACALPSISLTKTVGTDPAICALTDEIAVPAGTDVTYCYEVENTGDVTLNLHDLDDSELGTILSAFPYALSPGASAFLTATATITASTVNTATWTAYNAGPIDVVTATDTATVKVLAPAIALRKTVGTDPAICALTDEIAVPPGTDVTYCYEVENTGDVTLSFHDLDDSELGVLLSGFPYALSPGASAFLTATATITVTTINTATWTAYNAGPIDVVKAVDTATVTVSPRFIFLPLVLKTAP